MRPRALLPLRRDRRQPGRAVPHRGRQHAARHLEPAGLGVAEGGGGGVNGRPVHLHDVQAGDVAGGGEDVWGAVSAQ